MRNKLKVSPFQSLLFVLFFIAPHTLSSITPPSYQNLLMVIVCIGYVYMFITNYNISKKLINIYSIPIILIPLLGVILKYIEYSDYNLYSIIMPIVGFWGYNYIIRKHLRTNIIEYFLLFLYVFFIITYYLHLPSLFFRDNTFNDGDWYGVSSSNAIPIALINTLYIYIVIIYLQNEKKHGKILLFSVINFLLIVIQGSRAGLIISLIIVTYSLYRYLFYKKSLFHKRLFIFLTLILISASYYFTQTISYYLDDIGFNSEGDARQLAWEYYFGNLDIGHFLFGYKSGTIYSANNSYTFNVWLDYWNKYTFVGLLVLVLLFLRRIFLYKVYFFPLYFLLPFFMYSWVEPRYLPCYWDFFIYLLLLLKK